MKYQKENIYASESGINFELNAFSDIGDRNYQQDCFGYLVDNEKAIITVCDGMGGLEGGQFASNTAVSTVLSEFSLQVDFSNPSSIMTNAVKMADKKICGLVDEFNNPLDAGSTCVSAILKGYELYWNSVGDSRLYLYRGGAFVQISTDHNYGAVLDAELRTGAISLEEYEKEYESAEGLVSYLGIGDLELIDYNEIPFTLTPGDKLILMSDGLYKLVDDTEIKTVFSNFGQLCDIVSVLKEKARKNAAHRHISRDNITFVVLEIK